jgi:hypothetical protein
MNYRNQALNFLRSSRYSGQRNPSFVNRLVYPFPSVAVLVC